MTDLQTGFCANGCVVMLMALRCQGGAEDAGFDAGHRVEQCFVVGGLHAPVPEDRGPKRRLACRPLAQWMAQDRELFGAVAGVESEFSPFGLPT